MATPVKLTCRFYKARYPVVGSIVMAKVERIQDGAAFASLLEYNKIEAVIFFSNEDEVTVGRTSPFRVSKVTTDNRVIVLDRSPPSMQEIWSCERRFLKARHVHNVLFSVSEEQRINLKVKIVCSFILNLEPVFFFLLPIVLMLIYFVCRGFTNV